MLATAYEITKKVSVLAEKQNKLLPKFLNQMTLTIKDDQFFNDTHHASENHLYNFCFIAQMAHFNKTIDFLTNFNLLFQG